LSRKRTRKPRFKPKAKRPTSIRDAGQTVRRLTAEGYTGDEVAQLTGMNKNSLRAKHALDLHAGREIKAAEKAATEGEKLSQEEEIQRRAIFAGHLAGGEHWLVNGVSLLTGLTLPQTQTLWAEWLRRSRAGNRVLPIILEAELFGDGARSTKPVRYGDPV